MSDDENLGLYPKYRAIKVRDELSETGGPIKIDGLPQEEVAGPYFLMRFDDPFAVAALRTYASMCRFEYPKLAEDINAKLDEVNYSGGDSIEAGNS